MAFYIRVNYHTKQKKKESVCNNMQNNPLLKLLNSLIRIIKRIELASTRNWMKIVALLLINNMTNGQISNFDHGPECWTVFGDGSGPTQIVEGGNPGGYIEVMDLHQGGGFYYSAPSQFLGNKSASFNHQLKFDLKTSAPAAGITYVILEGNGQKLTYIINQAPTNNWTTIAVTLNSIDCFNSLWAPATNGEVLYVLGNLTRLLILGEFSGTADIGGLDNVILEPSGTIVAQPSPICAGAVVNFFDHSVNNPSSWTWSFPGALQTNSSLQNSFGIYYEHPGNYPVILIAYNSCLTDTLIDTITVAPHYDLSHSDSLCPGETLLFSNGYSITEPGVYDLHLRSIYGCDSNVLLTVYQLPPTPVNAIPVTTSCYGSSDGMIQFNTYPPHSLQHYFIPGFGENTSGIFTGLPAGDYIGEVTDQHQCKQLIPFTILQPEPVIQRIVPGAYLGLDPHSSTTIWVISNYTNNSYTWSPDEFLSCSDCPAPIIQPDQNICYNIAITSEVNGHSCTADTSICVIIRPVIYLPNTFTPNSDGLNDKFRLQGEYLSNIRDFNLVIYNRWGEKIFETQDTGFQWDGTLGNEQVPVGVYTCKISYLIPITPTMGYTVDLAPRIINILR